MTATRVLYNEDEYIDGLLDNSPAIIESIYRHFAKKVKSFIHSYGGSMKDAAHIFEETLLDIYRYACQYKLVLTNRFEPFFMLICKVKWRNTLAQRGQVSSGERGVPEKAILDNTHLKYVQEIVMQGEQRRHWMQLFQEQEEGCRHQVMGTLLPHAEGVLENPANKNISQDGYAACMAALLTRHHDMQHTISKQDVLMVMDYIQRMSEEEKAAFEAKLPSQPPLQLALKSYREATQWLKLVLTPDHTLKELVHTLADQRQQWFPTKDRQESQAQLYVIGIAIIAAILATLLYISPWRKDVYRQFAPTEMVHDTIGQDDTGQIMHAASTHFNKRRFNQAIGLLTQAIRRDTMNMYARYYRGICLLENDQFNAARQDLQRVYGSKSTYRYDAAFYLGLSYLKNNDKQRCLEWLYKIPESAPNYVKATKLVQEIQ
ncbi:tetratricopeptide repeat protein [Chitinophaga pendula]|uniref:tetratricopeptide repeat protein n=1 Tax=Chitinophaga TaxID=79328 RepID=UPI000BAFAA0E|nr:MULTISPECIES: tetratricopeptide repeat protein [Chitinophaga]ASZ11127.1 hypothetical protein CK934_09210 [Chitinophaga sp. MD30]UCJ05876.1 tetratricopeptide repeat protein [Chitinophaga pendula]